MNFEQDIAHCLASRIGDGGIPDADLEAAVAATARVLGRLRDQARDPRAAGSLPLLAVPSARADLTALKDVVARFRGEFDDVLVLGTGGSSLGGQTLCALSHWPASLPRKAGGGPRLHFMDNIDPATFGKVHAGLDLARSGVIVISKSGSTAETAMQFFTLIDAYIERVGKDALAKHFVAVTEPAVNGKANPLRRAAGRFGIQVFEHDPGVGGRYSALTNVGLLPAMIAGLDAKKVRDGAQAVLDAALSAKTPADSAPAVGAALAVAASRRGMNQSVLMPYVDRLASFAFWYRQLWAESLGKDGQGTTPINALGTVDQHSQLQLYLAGPKDKLYTLMLGPAEGAGDMVMPALAAEPEFSYLVGRTMGDLLDAEQRATAETLARNGRPTRILRVSAIDEATMGGLMMHFMLETIIAADLLGVDPFDQPAVEEGKVLARKYLSAMGPAVPASSPAMATTKAT
ncbi:MAG TPA: glucose-6-phosphate isomerase [Alphaproteobacteria bacterium]|nr:glucose-6-phosphate isomerase [Alphaproteobacteria bacterium]